MSGFITGIPLFVWPLFGLLLFLGLRARRDRTVPVALIYGLPFFVVMALQSVAALPAGGWIWGLFAIAYLAGVAGGFSVQGRWIMGYAEGKVALRGESLTLFVMMVLFWANFVSGTLEALAPDTYTHPLYLGLFVICVAAGSGSFGGRAVRVMRRR